MVCRYFLVVVAALAAGTGLAPGAAAQLAHVDMLYNPAPVIGARETIDLTFPPAFGAEPPLFLFSRPGTAPCGDPSQCFRSFTRTALGRRASIRYTVSADLAAAPVAFFFVAVRGGQIAVSDMGEITVSPENVPLPRTKNPILFVTQVPIPEDYTNVASSFGSQQGAAHSAPRGGDLYIRYADGALKNLTKLAGFGNSGLQLEGSIAVRDPTVHWSGTKAVFSMVVGAGGRGDERPFYWQLYEVTGLGRADTPVITRVPRQPRKYNNVSPAYTSDGRILFASDRPRDGARHLYPQRDEYESAPTNTGLWSLDPRNGELFLLEHAPSGAFKPSVDSFGRIVFTRWDHLERDQQKTLDLMGQGNYQTFNYSDESATAAITASNFEHFPEPHTYWVDYVNRNPGYAGDRNGWAPNLVGNTFHRFLPWTINQDGTQEETLNHVGRHELANRVTRALADDPNLIDHFLPDPRLSNQYALANLLQIRESGRYRGVYLGIDCPEFDTHAAGQIVALTGRPQLDPERMRVVPVTHPDTRVPTLSPSPDHSGFYRNPLQLSGGQLVSAHTATTRKDSNAGTHSEPRSLYDFRLETLARRGAFWSADRRLTPGIQKTVQYWDPFTLVSSRGELWELDPVEVVARRPPPAPVAELPAPEAAAIASAAVRPGDLVQYLRSRDLALVVARNVTTRDRNDRQQPFNLRVAGTSTETVATSGRVYDVAHLQLFQADQIRSMFWGGSQPIPGRRVLAQPLHEPAALNPVPGPGAPSGSVVVARDGSMAALVPARRALTWQLTDTAGDPVVRERYWVSFQPGEIRSCPSCHGASRSDQLGRPDPTNEPQALTELLRYLKSIGEPLSGPIRPR